MKQGDIFVSSWGYDQTNVDFHEVVKVAAKTEGSAKRLHAVYGHADSGKREGKGVQETDY